MTKKTVTILSVLHGPLELDDGDYMMLCNVKADVPDDMQKVQEVRSESFNELYGLQTRVLLDGPQDVTMEWVDDV